MTTTAAQTLSQIIDDTSNYGTLAEAKSAAAARRANGEVVKICRRTITAPLTGRMFVCFIVEAR